MGGKMSNRDIDLAKSLATAGYEMDLEIQQKTSDYAKKFPKTDLFLVAIVQSLIWTGHAIDKVDYFKNALDYLNTGSEKALSSMSKCFGRYGAESLKSTLFNWRKLYSKFKIPSDMSKSSLNEIVLFQKESLEIACIARSRGEIIGVGAWLFCAPFKIVLCVRSKLWDYAQIDEILMPLGLEVVRGVKKLMRKKSAYTESLYADMLSETEGDIREGLGTVELVQAVSKKIAKDSRSIILHINSGLWKLGAGDV